MCDAEDAALLQRARRLVLQLQRPASKSTQSDGVSRERLPAIAASPAPPEPPRRKKTKAHRDKRAQEEAKRLGEERKRHERELDKVKQAQERARARVARTNQLEQQQTLRAVEQQHSEVASAAEQCAEKIRKVQQSRRRAKERVRVKRLEKLADTPPPSSAPDLRAEPEKVKAFHREAISRLQISKHQASRIIRNQRVDTPGNSEEVDEDQKLLEKRLRKETKARLRRMQQRSENQKRREQKEFEESLHKFKSKFSVLDRAARDLSKHQSLPQIDQRVGFEAEEIGDESITLPRKDATHRLSLAEGGPTWVSNQDADSSSDSDEGKRAHEFSISQPDQVHISSPLTGEVITHRSRLPAWKQPHVPIQPTQNYSYKAILPAHSRVSVTAPGYTISATRLVSATRVRAQ